MFGIQCMAKRPIQIWLDTDLIDLLDRLFSEAGLRSRSELIELTLRRHARQVAQEYARLQEVVK